MLDRNYYVICDDNCRFEGMTKEQILSAIAEATGNTPTSVDDAFVSKLKEMNTGANFTVWIGTMAQFNAIPEKENDRLYIITDEAWGEDIEAEMLLLKNKVEALRNDTGWQDIKRKDKHEMGTVVIGKYRIIGKTVYINIEYDYSEFLESTATSDTIVLPVVIDCPPIVNVRGFEFTIPFVEERDVSPQYTFRIAQIGIDYAGLKLNNISLMNSYYRTQLSFSAPYKEMNPNYPF